MLLPESKRKTYCSRESGPRRHAPPRQCPDKASSGRSDSLEPNKFDTVSLCLGSGAVSDNEQVILQYRRCDVGPFEKVSAILLFVD